MGYFFFFAKSSSLVVGSKLEIEKSILQKEHFSLPYNILLIILKSFSATKLFTR